jgi:cell division protein FtsZ
MTNGGVAHIGIGEAKGDDKALEAVQQAVESPLLETSIKGAENVIINISGDISLMDANDAASYVQDITGEEANIIFGAMYDDSEVDTCRITVIATGLIEEDAAPRAKRETRQSAAPQPRNNNAFGRAPQAQPAPQPYFGQQDYNTTQTYTPQPEPVFDPSHYKLQQPTVQGSVPKKDIQIPDFLKNRNR